MTQIRQVDWTPNITNIIQMLNGTLQRYNTSQA
jgi:hypothetical protein